VTLSQQDDDGSILDKGSTHDQVKSTLTAALEQNLGEIGSQMILEAAYLDTFVGGGIFP